MNTGFVFKISVLVVAFIVVIYGISELKSPSIQTKVGDPDSFLGALLGGDQRLFNWCHPNVERVEVFDQKGQVIKVLTSAQDISAVCELMIGGFSQGDEKQVFSLKLRSHSKTQEAPIDLEQSAKNTVFSVKGMPFSCPGLVNALVRLEAK